MTKRKQVRWALIFMMVPGLAMWFTLAGLATVQLFLRG